MIIEKYLHDTAQYEAKTSARTAEGKTVYSTATTIACRKEGSSKVVSKISGLENKEVKATSVYYTLLKINEEDMLDGRLVIDAREYKGRNGTIEGYESYV